MRKMPPVNVFIIHLLSKDLRHNRNVKSFDPSNTTDPRIEFYIMLVSKENPCKKTFLPKTSNSNKMYDLIFSDGTETSLCISLAEEDYTECMLGCGVPIDPSCGADCGREYRIVRRVYTLLMNKALLLTK